MKRNIFAEIVLGLSGIIFAINLISCGGGGGGSAPLSSEKSITAFSFTSPAATGSIGQSANTILVNVPSGTNVAGLVANFTTTGRSVTVGGTIQTSGVTSSDFTSPVIYTVTAADGSTQNYLVTVRAGALPPQWARTVTAGSDSYFNSVAMASDGSVYAAGYISGTGAYDFGNSVTSGGTYTGANTVLVKYTSSGVAQWARTVTAGGDYSEFYSVSVAADGSVYAAGRITGTETYDFGNSVTSAGTYTGANTVLVKYSSSGVVQWARTMTAGSDESELNSVSVAADGSVYAAGRIAGTGTYDFGNSVTAAGVASYDNVLLVKYNSSGEAQWARTMIAGSDVSFFHSVSATADGSVYAAGGVIGTGTYDFGNGVTSAGTYTGANIVLVKYSSSGVAQWARTMTAGSDVSFFHSVSATADGSVYAAGGVIGTGTYDFGNSVTSAGTYTDANIVLVKYSSSGVAQWARTMIAGSDRSTFYSLSAAPDDSVYAAGGIIGTGTYGLGNGVTAAGSSSGENIVLVKYSSSGAAQWAQTMTAGSDDSDFNSVFAASDGSVYAAGGITGTGTFNFGNSITATGTNVGSSIVLVKYY